MSCRAGRRALGVHLPGRVQRHQPCRLHLRGGVCDPVLHRLLVGQQGAVRVARQRALAQHVERAPRDPEPAHAVVDPPRAEPLLGDQEAGTARAEQRVQRHVNVLVDDLGVTAVRPVALGRVLHRRHVAHDPDARRVHRHDEHRRALVAVRVWVGDGHHDQEVGDRRVRREPLAAADHPPIAVLDRARRAASGRCPRCPARSSRTPTAGHRPAADAATAPSDRRCPRARAPPSCPSPAPGCQTPPGRTGSTRESRASARA